MNLLRPVLQIALFSLFLIFSFSAAGQGVGIGTDNPHPSAILDLASDSSGILIPRMTGAQRDAIDTLAQGLLVYVTDDSSFYFYTGATWSKLGNADGILSDVDGDTKVMVELDPDDDIIRFETAGEEHFRIIGNRLEPVNSGKSVYIGAGTGASNQLDTARNVFIGDSTGVRDTSFYNTAVGAFALKNNTAGAGNTALGTQSMMYNESGTGNTGLGVFSMVNNKTGFNNVALGTYALYSDTSANNNTAVGVSALNRIMGGTSNTALGRSAMGFSNSGTNNVAIGESAGNFSEGDNNVLIGFRAGFFNEASDRLYIENSLADSSQALIYGEFDNDFLRINGRLFPKEGITDIDGDTRLQVEETEDEDVLRIDLGGTEYFVLDSGRINVRNTGGSVFIGDGAGANDYLTGNLNVATGDSALYSNTTGYDNIAVGYGALFSNTTGYNNVATGVHALQHNTLGTYNVATGSLALQHNTTGFQNVAIGGYAMENNTTGFSNLAIGFMSMRSNQTGRYNVATGRSALSSNTAGWFNMASGSFALYKNMTGSQNIAVGDRAGYNSMGDNSIFIGSHAGYNETASNRLYIENSDADSTGALIYGEFDNDFLRVNGRLFPKEGITDADGDTRLQLEMNADEDILRIDLEGTEHYVFDKGRIHVKNTGLSVFLGDGAGASDDMSDNLNVGLGHQALTSNSTGSGNSAVGYGAMWLNIFGSGNSAFGENSMSDNISGIDNSAMGRNALVSNTTGNYNSGFGVLSLAYNQTGFGNTAIGYEAGYSALGDSSVFIGISAGKNETAGHRLYIENSPANASNALIYGEFDNDLLRVNGTLNVNGAYDLPVADGTDGQILTTDGLGNASWSDLAPAVVVTDADNDTKIQVEESADEDIIRFDIGGTERFIMNGGRLDMRNTGESVFIGENAGAVDDLTSNKNVYIGFESGMVNVFGGQNVAVGWRAMKDNTTGFNNVAVGLDAFANNTTGHNNVAVGIGSLVMSTTGIFNTALGTQALLNSNGNNNLAVGYRALFLNTGGSSNVAVGSQAGYSTTGNGGVFLGNAAGINETQGNRLYIENTGADAANALIYGEFDTDYLRVNGHLSTRNGFSDADKDTKIQVEEGADDDVIRFDIAGTENFVMHDGRLEFLNSGNSVFIGEGAGLFDDQTDNSNVAIGAGALGANTTGKSNVAIGRSAGASTTGTFNIFIGQKAGQFDNSSNKLYIEPTGADADNALIYGDFATDALKLNGSVAVKNRSANGTAFEVLNSASSALLIVKEAGSISMPAMPTGSGSAVQITGGLLVSNTSTRRDKRKIATFEDEFEKILQVQPRKYERPHTPGKTEIGYIAEEMDSIGLGALVLRSDEGVIEGLTYDKIVMYTNEVVKQHESRINALEALVEKQAAQIQLQHDNIDDQRVLIETQAALIDRLLGQGEVQQSVQEDSNSLND